MDALTPPERASDSEPDPADRFAAAARELRKAAQVGALLNDPLRHVLEGIAGALGAMGDINLSLGTTSQQLSIAVEHMRQPVTQDVLGPVQRAAAAGATAEVLMVARSIRMRTAILGGICVGIAAVMGAVAGYAWGRADAVGSFRATQAGFTAAFRYDPKDAARWLELMRWNDLDNALTHCQSFTDQSSGRQACMVPLWTSPPKVRVPGA